MTNFAINDLLDTFFLCHEFLSFAGSCCNSASGVISTITNRISGRFRVNFQCILVLFANVPGTRIGHLEIFLSGEQLAPLHFMRYLNK
jgi:hypothetical protein